MTQHAVWITALCAALGAATAAPATSAHVDAPAGVTTSVTLYPVADTYVDQQNPTQNFNTAAQWPVERRTNNTERYPLLRFDTSAIPEDATVTSADLKVYLMSGSGDSPILVKVERITFTWNQDTVTWNSRPPVAGVYGSWETDNDPGTRTFDIRVLAANWIRDAWPNHGVTLRGPDGGTYERLYRSTGATRPHLDIVYTAPEPTATATSSSTAGATPSPSATSTATPSSTSTPAPTSTPTSSPTTTPTQTSWNTSTASPTATPSPTSTSAPSTTPTDPPTATSTPTETPLPPGSATITATTSPTPSITPPTPATATPSDTPTYGSQTPSPTPPDPDTPTPLARHNLYLPLSLRSATMEPDPPTPLASAPQRASPNP
ncbi:MAG: DNRLRE domain-containing protein [Ardenticatenales bacterium]|nr:DNRLRE domain-containing protein [Ardenticatenales bacterium]